MYVKNLSEIFQIGRNVYFFQFMKRRHEHAEIQREDCRTFGIK